MSLRRMPSHHTTLVEQSTHVIAIRQTSFLRQSPGCSSLPTPVQDFWVRFGEIRNLRCRLLSMVSLAYHLKQLHTMARLVVNCVVTLVALVGLEVEVYSVDMAC